MKSENELDFLKKTVFIQWSIRKKDLRLFATKLIEKIHDPQNDKEHYQSIIRNKNTKLLKQSEKITRQPKILETQTLLILNQLL